MSGAPAGGRAGGPPTVEPLDVAGAEGILARPAGPVRCGVLVLTGSSGVVDTARCELLARSGALALGLRWFGGPGQVPGVCEVPLETFTAGLDLLAAQGVPRLAVLGLSKSAEAAALLATRDDRLDAVVAFAPTDVVWANVGPGRDGEVRPQRSSWTWRGEPLPFVPYDDDWVPPSDPADGPVAYVDAYRSARELTGPRSVADAAVSLAGSRADVLLVAGEDDQVWPSVPMAHALAATRPQGTVVVTHPAAGHRTPLPGETPRPASASLLAGGTPEADAALGRLAWPHVVRLLGLDADG